MTLKVLKVWGCPHREKLFFLKKIKKNNPKSNSCMEHNWQLHCFSPKNSTWPSQTPVMIPIGKVNVGGALHGDTPAWYNYESTDHSSWEPPNDWANNNTQLCFTIVLQFLKKAKKKHTLSMCQAQDKTECNCEIREWNLSTSWKALAYVLQCLNADRPQHVCKCAS